VLSVFVWSPESGWIGPPSRMSMFQRTSLYCALSALSPVCSVNASGLPVAGPFFTALMPCTIASATCRVRNSWGR